MSSITPDNWSSIFEAEGMFGMCCVKRLLVCKDLITILIVHTQWSKCAAARVTESQL